MNSKEVLDEITTSLLSINKDIFHTTGTAPQLAVYVTEEFFRQLVGEVNKDEILNRERELLMDETIMGYPVFTVSEEVNPHSPYQIVQILRKV